MKNNPHEHMIVDEASGVEVVNQRWKEWEDGYYARMGDEISVRRTLEKLKELREGNKAKIDTSKLTVIGDEEIRTCHDYWAGLSEDAIKRVKVIAQAQLGHTIKELEG